MANSKRPLRPLQLGRTVHQGRADEPVHPVSGRVPAHKLAPDRNSAPISPEPDEALRTLHIALIIPLARFASFSKWVQGNIRVLKPKGWDGEVVVNVLPDLGDEMVDFDQYDTPTLNLTKPKSVPE